MLLMRRFVWALPAILVVPLLTGCAALSARSKAPELPPMNVPPPPARVIEPAPEPLPEPVAELPAAPPSSAATRTNTRPAAPRTTPQPDSKPADPKPVEPPPPTTPQEPAPIPQPPAQPTAQLRTPQTADTSNAEKTVRAIVERTRGLLANVDYRLLNSERKKAYDDTRGYITEAEEKLKEGNLVYADAVAKKAERLARELAGK